MMGMKLRRFGPLDNVQLDQFVPASHFYRHVERTLDLAFVRDLVRACYATGGRPSSPLCSSSFSSSCSSRLMRQPLEGEYDAPVVTVTGV